MHGQDVPLYQGLQGGGKPSKELTHGILALAAIIVIAVVAILAIQATGPKSSDPTKAQVAQSWFKNEKPALEYFSEPEEGVVSLKIIEGDVPTLHLDNVPKDVRVVWYDGELLQAQMGGEKTDVTAKLAIFIFSSNES